MINDNTFICRDMYKHAGGRFYARVALHTYVGVSSVLSEKSHIFAPQN